MGLVVSSTIRLLLGWPESSWHGRRCGCFCEDTPPAKHSSSTQHLLTQLAKRRLPAPPLRSGDQARSLPRGGRGVWTGSQAAFPPQFPESLRSAASENEPRKGSVPSPDPAALAVWYELRRLFENILLRRRRRAAVARSRSRRKCCRCWSWAKVCGQAEELLLHRPARGGGEATKTLVSEWQNISDLTTTNPPVAALQGGKGRRGHLNKH